MKTLWTFGCSYTDSLKTMVETDQNFGHYSTFCQYKDWRGGVIPPSWPDLLSQKLNYKLKNKGQGSSSNYQIFSQFCKNVKNYKEGDMIIIEWTSMERFRFAKDNRLVSLSVGYLENNYEDMISTKTLKEILVNRMNPVWTEEVWEWIGFINEFCKLKGINILYWNADDNLLLKGKSLEKFIFVEKLSLHTFIQRHETIPTQIRTETKGEVDDGHCGEFGHKLQADLIYEHIKNKGII